ncbi:heme ABC transporter substrate-binding protein IsdE [Virgibacillus soli]|uniref:heme ABC transporter substrate-binding protein IsdE n=1 Tax=Paracerasibacillus soli TaxID=480284 RepID=UPI0035EB104F
MKNSLKLWVMLLGIIFIVAGCGANDSASEKEKDTNADKVKAAEANKPEDDHRIIATTVAITEIMDKLDIDLVGIPTSYKELPERYKDATEIGSPMSPDMELMLSLKPTDILSVTTLLDNMDVDFSNLDIKTQYLDFTSVDHMLNEIEKVGKEYNRTEQANQLITQYEDKMAEIEARVAGKDAPSVLILMGIPGSYIVGTEHSYIGDLVKRAGGVNVVTDRDEEYISGNTEYLQQLKPDIILRAAHGMPEEVVKMFEKEFKENDVWKHFKAVQNNRVYDLEETRFGTTANLAAIEALDELVDILYPDEK